MTRSAFYPLHSHAAVQSKHNAPLGLALSGLKTGHEGQYWRLIWVSGLHYTNKGNDVKTISEECLLVLQLTVLWLMCGRLQLRYAFHTSTIFQMCCVCAYMYLSLCIGDQLSSDPLQAGESITKHLWPGNWTHRCCCGNRCLTGQRVELRKWTQN